MSFQVVFLSIYFNHHQKPLSDALYRLTGGSFRFVETQLMGEFRRKLGYVETERPDYVIRALTKQEQTALCKTVEEADVVLMGHAPEFMLKDRIRSGKIIFRYSERPLKTGNDALKYLPRLIRWHGFNPPGSRIYMMCASAYTPLDYSRFGLFRNRCFKFGYFPEFCPFREEDLFERKKGEPVRILWAGRLIDWKHPEAVLYLAEKLRDSGVPFRIEMIGLGEMEEQLKERIRERNLSDEVFMSGSMTPPKVREHMAAASVFLSTSDRQEGWGTVLNEAMNAGCAVVASHAAGGAPFLIRHGENGLLFESGNWDGMTDAVLRLLKNRDRCAEIGIRAYRTIAELWNADVAAKRFLRLVQTVEENGETPFSDGPCSRAEVLRDNWFMEEEH
ncbi:MAG: glycosyltransferase family 4 protein [Clostridia bacterium]|nr:glycosyltransferase family 4 protein [Clostridia bacterium]